MAVQYAPTIDHQKEHDMDDHPMTGEELLAIRTRWHWSNRDLATMFGRANPSTVDGWITGRTAIPLRVRRTMRKIDAALSRLQMPSKENWHDPYPPPVKKGRAAKAAA